MKTVLRSAASVCVAAGLATSVAFAQPRGNAEAALAGIEAKWSGVMTTIRGWNEDSFRQFREGYREYPADVLERALAAPSFEKMMETLDGHAALRSQEAMAKAFPKAHSMGATAPEDAANPQLVEARQLAAKSLGDDARDLVFIPITPCTVWDSRYAFNPDSVGPITNGATKRFYSHLDGAGGTYAAYGGNPSCPETAQNFIGVRPFAVMMTVYINDATAQGWLTVYRDGDPDPSLATISVYFSPGPTRTQTVISKSSRGYGAGTFDVAATARFASTHASAAVTGYFVKVNEIGTVSSVATGPGLTGGPITTSGTINLASTNLLPTVACAATQIPRWSGSAWACSADIDTNSGGTVTSVGASAPLASSGGSTPSISFAATTSGTVLAGTGGAPAFTGSPSISGNFTMVNSTAAVGTLYKGATRFIHNFGSSNTFVGLAAGNFTLTGNSISGFGAGALSANTTGTANTAVGSGALNVNTTGSFNTAVGTAALANSNADGNTALGLGALSANTSGQQNTATGNSSLGSNTTGNYNTAAGGLTLATNTVGAENTAYGAFSLNNNTSGDDNTAVGISALFSNTTGDLNAAIGAHALFSNTVGFQNTALGRSTLYANTIGNQNTAIGSGALANNTTGTFNIALGTNAGVNSTTGNSNILIGHSGFIGEGNTIRVGISGFQTRAFISGIRGVATGVADAIAVLVDSGGQLGTISSSRRVKDDVADMKDASSALMKLRPVTFHYKEYGPASRLQYGLIAEEVESVYPGLVAKHPDGSAETVMYHYLPPMLLNEYQRQQRTIEAQAQELAKAVAEVAELRRHLARIDALLERKTGGN